ncbi:hypothetical protein Pcinc_029222 [Petrolisthes cinctipes]|uniref:Uncharacterized protein n=1 Tax=Petrolisthes cinctipes TaxID=88211 RepID=A0AAE1F0I3_PETCI|nr:hypothetical protein Pcinc_029222 [Petrolisthes cinctipes]
MRQILAGVWYDGNAALGCRGDKLGMKAGTGQTCVAAGDTNVGWRLSPGRQCGSRGDRCGRRRGDLRGTTMPPITHHQHGLSGEPSRGPLPATMATLASVCLV